MEGSPPHIPLIWRRHCDRPLCHGHCTTRHRQPPWTGIHSVYGGAPTRKSPRPARYWKVFGSCAEVAGLGGEGRRTICGCSVAISRLKGPCTITPGLGSRLDGVNLGWVDGTSSSTSEISSEATSAATALSKTTSVGERGRGESEFLTSKRFNIQVQSLPLSPTAIFGAIPNSSWLPMMQSSSIGAGHRCHGPAATYRKVTGRQDLADGVHPNLPLKLQMAAVLTKKQ